jgi:hypothetical protein
MSRHVAGSWPLHALRIVIRAKPTNDTTVQGDQDVPEEEQFLTEGTRCTPVRDRVGVLVAGGGLSGVAAALAAARSGAETLLVERNSYVGGVATAGMCCSIFNCYFTAEHRLAITGISTEITDTLAAVTGQGQGQAWRRHKGHVIYDVELAKLALARMLQEAGVRIRYQSPICDVVREGNRVQGVILESESGREAVLSHVVVDATGDADVAWHAGAALHVGAPKASHSFCFRVGGVDVDRFVQSFVDHPAQYPDHMDVDWTLKEAVAQYQDTGTFLFPHGGAMQMDVFKQAVADGEFPTEIGLHDTLDACQMHALRERGTVHIVTGTVHFDQPDADRVTQAILDGRRMAHRVTDFLRKSLAGFEGAWVISTADNLGIRASRWLDGEFVFKRCMREETTRFPDAVGRGAVQRNLIKHSGKRAWGVQVLGSSTFDVPFRCLVPRDLGGLLVGAGRSVSTEDPYLLRTLALTMVVGQAAGTAAAVAAKAGDDARTVDVAAVQEELARQGVELGPLA